MASYMQAVEQVYDVIESIQSERAGAIAKKQYEGLYATVKHYVTRLGKTYILGYNPALWRLSSYNNLAFFENGKTFNLLSTTANIYQLPTYLVGAAFTATALEAAMMLHMQELETQDYGKFIYLVSKVEGIGYDLEHLTGEYGLFDLARNLPI